MKKIRYLLVATLTFGLASLLSGCNFALLNPQGSIAVDEKSIMITSAWLMSIIVIPVILMVVMIAWRYRASNESAKYTPEWSHSTALEVLLWAVPCIIIIVLSWITWVSSHQLDPYKPIVIKDKKTLVIEAISLEWKWLFIYPEQNIATVNYLEIPVGTPVEFLISAEGPMNSLQIPQLAGQIYAMAGMQTKLNLVANTIGDYQGLSTNFSGDGFSDMNFIAHVTTQDQFDEWAKSVKQAKQQLTMTSYNELVVPSQHNAVAYYSSANKDIFNTVVMKTMMPMPMQMPMKEMADASH